MRIIESTKITDQSKWEKTPMSMPLTKVADIRQRVITNLEIWAERIKSYDVEAELGFGKCMGFSDSKSVSGWDDFADSVDNYMADNVQAIYDGLSISHKLAVDNKHLGAVWRSNRQNLDDLYEEALLIFEIALRRRGLL